MRTLSCQFCLLFAVCLPQTFVFGSDLAAVYPGTKWCGYGDKGNDYNDLGYYNETDACCRDHDICPDMILAFDTKHGLKNWSLFTKSACWCDEEFYSCLKKSSDGIGETIGRMFFNLIQIKCYTDVHPLVCVERGWLDICTKYAEDKTKLMKKFVDNRWF